MIEAIIGGGVIALLAGGGWAMYKWGAAKHKQQVEQWLKSEAAKKVQREGTEQWRSGGGLAGRMRREDSDDS